MIEMGFKEGFTMTLNYLEELLTEVVNRRVAAVEFSRGRVSMGADDNKFPSRSDD